MESRLIALKLFLDELGVPASISSLRDRKKVQKAVYLGQLSGVDLGYRFSWYLLGPYSPRLTRDYFRLAEGIEAGEREFETKKLKTSLRKALVEIKDTLEPPKEFPLPQEDWLELIASLHFLREKKSDEDEAVEELQRKKPRLAEFVDLARSKVRELATP